MKIKQKKNTSRKARQAGALLEYSLNGLLHSLVRLKINKTVWALEISGATLDWVQLNPWILRPRTKEPMDLMET